jgi:hypothetical protein
MVHNLSLGSTIYRKNICYLNKKDRANNDSALRFSIYKLLTQKHPAETCNVYEAYTKKSKEGYQSNRAI